MTKEQINTMEAGEELDAMIAEQVMGWKMYDLAAFEQGTRAFPHCYRFHDKVRVVRDGTDAWQVEDEVWAPSTDTAAAMTVAEKLADDWNRVTIELTPNGRARSWIVMLEDGPSGLPAVRASANTFPLAICRCALASLEGGAK